MSTIFRIPADEKRTLIIGGRLVRNMPSLGEYFLYLLQGLALVHTPGQTSGLFAASARAFYEITDVKIMGFPHIVFEGASGVVRYRFWLKTASSDTCAQSISKTLPFL